MEGLGTCRKWSRINGLKVVSSSITTQERDPFYINNVEQVTTIVGNYSLWIRVINTVIWKYVSDPFHFSLWREIDDKPMSHRVVSVLSICLQNGKGKEMSSTTTVVLRNIPLLKLLRRNTDGRTKKGDGKVKRRIRRFSKSQK